jgi:AraC family transcriptional regulator
MNSKENLFKRSYTDYIARINRVIDYIENNLSNELSLEELASYANFSKYHFHRIFSAVIGENLFEFIRRIRLEKAAFYLVTTPAKSITDIALMSGFASSQNFSKRFKKHFKKTPSEYRKAGKLSKISNNGQDLSSIPDYNCFGNGAKPGIDIRDFQGIEVAYLRYTGPYAKDVDLFSGLFEKLYRWAKTKKLTNGSLDFYIVYHDEPKITEENKLRISLSIPVDKNMPADGEIGRMRIYAGKYVFVSFCLKSGEFGSAWDWVYKTWLPFSGYEPDDNPAFEYYHNSGETSEGGFVKVSICIPVRKI